MLYQLEDYWFGGGRLEVVDSEVVILEVAGSAVVSLWLCVGWAVAWLGCGVLLHGMAWP